MQVLEKVDESQGLLARKFKSFINYSMGAFKFNKPIFKPLSFKPLKFVALTITITITICLEVLQTALQTTFKHTFKTPFQTKCTFIKSG